MEYKKIGTSGSWADISADINNNFDKASTEIMAIRNKYEKFKGYFEQAESLPTSNLAQGDFAFVGDTLLGGYKYIVNENLVWEATDETIDKDLFLPQGSLTEDSDTIQQMKDGIESLEAGINIIQAQVDDSNQAVEHWEMKITNLQNIAAVGNTKISGKINLNDLESVKSAQTKLTDTNNVLYFLIADSSGNLPSKQTCYEVPSEVTKQLTLQSPNGTTNLALNTALALAGYNAAPFGVNVGDLIALTRIKVKVSDLASALGISLNLSGEIELYQYKVISTNDAKDRTKTPSGVMGLMTPSDKEEINKISGIQKDISLLNSATTELNYGNSYAVFNGSFNMNECFNSGIYFYGTTGRSMEGNHDDERYIFIVNTRFNRNNKRYYIQQYAYSENYPSRVFYRVINQPTLNTFDASGYSEWFKLTDINQQEINDFIPRLQGNSQNTNPQRDSYKYLGEIAWDNNGTYNATLNTILNNMDKQDGYYRLSVFNVMCDVHLYVLNATNAHYVQQITGAFSIDTANKKQILANSSSVKTLERVHTESGWSDWVNTDSDTIVSLDNYYNRQEVDTKTTKLRNLLQGDDESSNGYEYPFKVFPVIKWDSDTDGVNAQYNLNKLLNDDVLTINDGSYLKCDGHYRINFAGVIYDLRMFVTTAKIESARVIQRITGNVALGQFKDINTEEIKEGLLGGAGTISTFERTYRNGTWGSWNLLIDLPQGIDVTSWFNEAPLSHHDLFPNHTFEQLLSEMRKHNFAYQLYMYDGESDNNDVLMVDYAVSSNDRIILSAYSPIIGKMHAVSREYNNGYWNEVSSDDDFFANSYDLMEIENHALEAIKRLDDKADNETFTAVTDSIYDDLDKLGTQKADASYVNDKLKEKVDLSVYETEKRDLYEDIRKANDNVSDIGQELDLYHYNKQEINEKNVYILNEINNVNRGLAYKQDTLDKDTIIKGELYKDDGSGNIVPVRHPDLSTQPSILPYKFAGNYVYEQIVFIPKSILGEKSTTLDVAYLVEKPIILDARLSIFRENFRNTTSPYCEVEVNSIDPKSVKTTIIYRDNSGVAELNDAWLRIVYTSQPNSNGGYYYYRQEKEIPSGIYVSLPPYTSISGLYGASEGVLIKERPFDVPAENSLWFIPDNISNVGSILFRDCSFEGNWDYYRGKLEDANTKEAVGYAIPYYDSGNENYGVGIEYRGNNTTHTLITLYSI